MVMVIPEVRRFLLGCDLAKSLDYTSFAVIEMVYETKIKGFAYHLGALDRIKAWTTRRLRTSSSPASRGCKMSRGRQTARTSAWMQATGGFHQGLSAAVRRDQRPGKSISRGVHGRGGCTL